MLQCVLLSSRHVLRRWGHSHITGPPALPPAISLQMLPLVYASIAQTILLRVEQTTPLGPDVPFRTGYC